MRPFIFCAPLRGVAALALAFVTLLSLVRIPTALAQSDDRTAQLLPPIDVVRSRLGDGIVGASTTIITSEEITRSTTQNLPELLSEQPSIQI